MKHDENFSTISKFSLCELILKILYFENKAMSYKEIASKLVEVVPGKVPQAKILEALLGESNSQKKLIKESNRKYLNTDHWRLGNPAITELSNFLLTHLM